MATKVNKAFNFSRFSKKYMMELILSVIVLVLVVTAPGFFTLPNILNIFRNVALFVGLCIGLFNGLIRTRYNIPSFIITLAMLNVLYGFAAIISHGFPVTTLPDWYNWIGAGQFFGIFPVPMLWLLIAFGIVYLIMNLTRFGREVYAVGGNPEAARLSGINVTFVKIAVLAIVQILAAFSGIILSAQVMSGSSTFGRGYEMDVISAVIIGGASLNGGIGKVWGTFIGIVFLGVINNGMTLFGVDDFQKYVVRGLLILFAVLLNTIQLQSLQKSDARG